MKILSNFKDYYDYLAYQYGVDDNIVFHRTRVLPLSSAAEPLLNLPECSSAGEENFRPQNEKYEHHLGSSNWLYYETGQKICQFECVSIVGTLYYYVYEYDRYSGKSTRRVTKESDYREYAAWRKKNNQKIMGHSLWMDVWAGERPYHGTNYRPGIVAPEDAFYGPRDIDRSLHQKLGLPILWKKIKNGEDSYALVMPTLSRIAGFSGICPPGRIYRDIYNFLQALRLSPDNTPPVAIDNESRILKHGFDLKKSFRHPVSARKKSRKGGKSKDSDHRKNI